VKKKRERFPKPTPEAHKVRAASGIKYRPAVFVNRKRKLLEKAQKHDE